MFIMHIIAVEITLFPHGHKHRLLQRVWQHGYA